MLNQFDSWQTMVIVAIGIIVVLYLLSLVLRNLNRSLGAGNKTHSLGVATAAPAVIPSLTAEADNKNAKIAAVMAAVQAMMGDSEYRVISIKPTGQSYWKQAVCQSQDVNYHGRKGN